MKITLDNLSREDLLEVLNESMEIFNEIDKIAIELRKKNKDLDFFRDTLSLLTSYYMYLNPIEKKLVANKANKSLLYFCKKKMEIESTGSKFTSAPIEKESRAFVEKERSALSYFTAYLESVYQAMITCRGRIKDFSSATNQNEQPFKSDILE